MKKRIIVISAVIISVLFLNQDSFSQDKKYFASILGGISIPIENYYVHQSSFRIEGRAGINRSKHLGVGLDIAYNKVPKRSSYGILSGGESSIFSFKGLMIFSGTKSSYNVTPYLTLAAGINTSQSLAMKTIWGDFNPSDFRISFGVDAGAGLSFNASEDININFETNANSNFDNSIDVFSFNFKTGVNYNF